MDMENENEKQLQENISKIFDEYQLGELNKHYFVQVKNDYDRIQNRKKKAIKSSNRIAKGSKSVKEDKMTKAEYTSNFKHQFAFLLWLALMTFIGRHFYLALTAGSLKENFVKQGIQKIMSGFCLPDLANVPNPTNAPSRFGTLLGNWFPWFSSIGADKLVSNPVCEAFRGSAAIIVGAIAMNPNSIALLPSVFKPLTLPFMLKKLIADVVDTVFKCFENPDYAAKINKEGAIAQANLQKEIRERIEAHEDIMIDMVTEDEEDARASEKAASAAEKKAASAEKKAAAAEKKAVAAEKKAASEDAKNVAAEAKIAASAAKIAASAEKKAASAAKKTASAAAKKAASASKKRTQKSNRKQRFHEIQFETPKPTQMHITATISNKDEMQIVPFAPKMSEDKFMQNLKDLGPDVLKMYQDGLKGIQDGSKKCSTVGKMKGGFDPFTIAASVYGAGKIVLATKLVVGSLFAAGTVYFNWDLFSSSKTNYDVLSQGILSKPEYATTNFVLNIFGLGSTCAGQNGLMTSAASKVFTGMSLYSIYAMSQAAGNTSANTLEGFVDYSSKIYTTFA
jgi:hypothetical protein